MTVRNSKPKPRLTQEEILRRFKNTHGDTYLYDKFIFTGVDNKATVTCRTHGDFEITPYHHSNRKQGCGKCSGKLLNVLMYKFLQLPIAVTAGRV